LESTEAFDVAVFDVGACNLINSHAPGLLFTKEGTRVIAELLLRTITSVPKVVSLWRRFPIGSVELRTRYGAWARPQYAYGTFHAARQAKALGLAGISVIEFGVAGGDGLLALERVAGEVARYFGIRISVLGFDTGEGMPSPTDYRDVPYVWGAGFYKMDQARLKKQLSPATRLMIGDVKQTVQHLQDVPDPIGFVAFDLDYYSSTKAAFAAFDLLQSTRLPRVYCYFDDIMNPEFACHNPWTGELCAIREFNEHRAEVKLFPLHMLRWMRPHAEAWNEQIYILHDFQHPLYSVNLMEKLRAQSSGVPSAEH
jgi:hypothetical protein